MLERGLTGEEQGNSQRLYCAAVRRDGGFFLPRFAAQNLVLVAWKKRFSMAKKISVCSR